MMENPPVGDLILAAVLTWAFAFIWVGASLMARRDDRRAKIVGALAVVVGLIPAAVALVQSTMQQGLQLGL